MAGAEVFINDAPKFDLDVYIQNYEGRTRVERLILIGKSCAPLRTDALRAAVVEAKQDRDVQRYKDSCDLLHLAAPAEPDAIPDQDWISATTRRNESEAKQLTEQLSMYKHNLIKESIRMGREELGKHLESTGDLPGALDMYTRMRADGSTTQHILDAGMMITRVHLQKRDWNTALSSAQKLSNQAEDNHNYQQWLRVVKGICLLGNSAYGPAANAFLSVMVLSKPSYLQVASPNDMAVYGGLLALATMNRDQLQKRVLDDTNFRAFLELEPHVRRAIGMFVNSRFASCLAILDAYKVDYLLDIYLQRHVSKIYSLIRRKCIIQYMIPFSCVTLDLLNKQFGQEGQSLEVELASMIRSGELKARIDSVDKVVTIERANPRVKAQIQGLAAVNGYEKATLERIRRISIQAAELEVRGGKAKGGGQAGASYQNIHDKVMDPYMGGSLDPGTMMA